MLLLWLLLFLLHCLFESSASSQVTAACAGVSKQQQLWCTLKLSG
jgi:hypothetical protein